MVFASPGVVSENKAQLISFGILPKDISVSSCPVKIESIISFELFDKIIFSPEELILKFVCKNESGKIILSSGFLISEMSVLYPNVKKGMHDRSEDELE